MLLNKVVVLLLLVFIVISVDHVSGGCCGNKCTNKQKKGILEACGPYIVKSNIPMRPPNTNNPCCHAVRTLQSLGEGMMQCVVDILDNTEKRQYDAAKFLHIEGPKTVTRGGVNGSRKISRETFGRCPKITAKHANQTP